MTFTLAIIKQLIISINVYFAFHLNWVPLSLHTHTQKLHAHSLWAAMTLQTRTLIGHLDLHLSHFKEFRLNGRF